MTNGEALIEKFETAAAAYYRAASQFGPEAKAFDRISAKLMNSTAPEVDAYIETMTARLDQIRIANV